MKKTILTFGLISGAISSLMMALAMPLEDKIGFGTGAEILGYTTIVLSLLLVFFGIRSYRDQALGGRITFTQAFAAGISITLISCICYVVTWEVIYFNFLPDFTAKYSAHLVEKAKASGASPAAIQAKLVEIQKFQKMYDNPFFNAMITFIEPFPIGLAITVISAAVLRKKEAAQPAPGRAILA
jgi:hypothetical protein